MRTFAIGDIHGGLKALIQVLNKLEIEEDKLPQDLFLKVHRSYIINIK